MKLKVYTPSDIFLNREVKKVVAESPAGSFCILPRHIDYVTALTTGILSYLTPEDEERFLAIDEGVLVKQGNEVQVAAEWVIGGELGELRQRIEHMMLNAGEREKKTRSSMARLEADFIRRFMEFGKLGKV
ncbi:MAG: F0F1 ATP synthase subunit epsilon [Desulfobacterales bacterium]|nr:F0F1 ATP synthase subunit epsilon [Desulfobacterales bacterium]MDD3082342.1 F0F1 ATP synthase subunit epsilon [Desulfobacterales bacterium]MDD3950478.1 F0F1 ATP synthase subunit epsilon [Desulfobacterales bacterium]MDD4463196.1 F0F1 ATP synthase subunit epsilon [Desulfobacterales bacterium]MDY0378547.1 F0F1 ATP synthase subunit epsilon [Desulfobacterales bacterium]